MPRFVAGLALLALVSTTPVSAQTGQAPPPEAPVRYDPDHLPADFHRSRRDAVRRAMPSGSVALVFGAPERQRSNDTNFQYRQDSDFYYLTGSEEPGSALLLVPGGVEVDGERVEEILFIPPRDPAAEVWTGRRFGVERAEGQLGVQMALENSRFDEVARAVLAGTTVLVEDLPGGVAEGSALASQLETLNEVASRPDMVDGPRAASVDSETLRRVLTGLREIKTPEEMVLLRRAIDITADAHRAVMQQVEPGWAEYEVEALIEYTFARNGAQYTGFPSIVGSGENSVILHYETNRKVTQAGEVAVIDIGAEVHGYSADITRTIPVSGTFTPEQRIIYDLVLAAQQAGIDAAVGGAPMQATHMAAVGVLLPGLAELGLIDGPRDVQGLRRFFMHGTSHYIGLDVHDTGSYGTLEPGMVITVEPGVYIPAADDIDPKWWHIGVRIEDDILITEGAPEMLSGNAPRTADDIEALMR
ncbi:MAG: aminopeptidase P N-terminal domain-containing protein [Longimicrobiales bacterium]